MNKKLWYVEYEFKVEDCTWNEQILVWSANEQDVECSIMNHLNFYNDSDDNTYNIKNISLYDDDIHGKIYYYEII